MILFKILTRKRKRKKEKKKEKKEKEKEKEKKKIECSTQDIICLSSRSLFEETCLMLYQLLRLSDWLSLFCAYIN
jgi:hypothetical protein